MPLDEASRRVLGRLFSEPSSRAAIDEFKVDLVKKATSKSVDAVSRQENLNMLWALEGLLVKIGAIKKTERED